MHHSSIGNPKTVTAKLYAIMSSPRAIGKWHSPLSLMDELRREYGIQVTALSTAPEMYEVLQKLLDFIECKPDSESGAQDIARLALAKARGEAT